MYDSQRWDEIKKIAHLCRDQAVWYASCMFRRLFLYLSNTDKTADSYTAIHDSSHSGPIP